MSKLTLYPGNPYPVGTVDWQRWETKQAMMTPMPATTSPVGQEIADKKRMWNELGGNLGVAGVTAGAQMAINAIPTAQDKLNKDRLAKLNAALDKGNIDETTAQAQAIEAESSRMQQQAAGRATEGRQRAEAIQAATGNTTSAAAALTPGREAQRAYSTDALVAGQTRLAARLEEAARQYKERDERTAYKSERQAQKRSAASQAIGQMAGIVGYGAAGRSTGKLDLPPDFASMSPETQKVVVEQAYANQRAMAMSRDQALKPTALSFFTGIRG
jgi:hypothetical protein